MLTLLTATGCRPQAWAICERLMLAQTYQGPVRWIIVDDGREAQPVTFHREGWSLEIVRREPFWRPGENTQAQNLLAGLTRVRRDGDRLVIVEDDDYYSPDWLERIAQELDKADLVGENLARYYNVRTRQAKQLSNRQHASLCSTAMKGAAIERLREVCTPGVKFIDLSLWSGFTGRKSLFGGNRVTGIKGLPGRDGIGMGHRREFRGLDDYDGALLRQWVGQDAQFYQ